MNSQRKEIILACSHIYQFDGIGNDVLLEWEVLKNAGYKVYFYAEELRSDKNHPILSDEEFRKKAQKPNILIIYHLANHWDRGLALTREFGEKVILRYHNTTPPEFFTRYSPILGNGAKLAVKQTKTIAKEGNFIKVISDSKFNSQTMISYGADPSKFVDIAPFNVLNDFDVKENRTSKHHGPIKVLFVSRFFPNKGHIHLLHTIRSYMDLFDDKIHLDIVGGIDPLLIKYSSEVNSLIRVLNLKKNVTVHGRVSFDRLRKFFQEADIYLCLSEHEGFGLTILEAQYNKIPVISYRCTALTDTIGTNQMTSDKIDYDWFASAINRVTTDQELHDLLIEEGYRNAQQYSMSKLAPDFIKAIEQI